MEIISRKEPKYIRVRDVEIVCRGHKHELVLWPSDTIFTDLRVMRVIIAPRPVLIEGRDMGHKGGQIEFFLEHVLSVSQFERDVIDPATADATET